MQAELMSYSYVNDANQNVNAPVFPSKLRTTLSFLNPYRNEVGAARGVHGNNSKT